MERLPHWELAELSSASLNADEKLHRLDLHSVRQPFRVGDRIQIAEATGDVIDVGYLDTTLWEFGGKYLSRSSKRSADQISE